MGLCAYGNRLVTRREVVLFSAAALAVPSSASADKKKPKIGFLSWFPPSMKGDLYRFRQGMRELGYTEPADYMVEAYFVSGNPQLASDMAQNLIAEPVDVIVAIATPAIHIAKAATQTIPIVMYSANAARHRPRAQPIASRRQSDWRILIADRHSR